MPTVLLVSPCFPPVNTPDMHRVRLGLPYFAEFGWEPAVLAVHPEAVDAPLDPALLSTVPERVPVYRAGALPVRWTRKIGFSNLGLRALPFLYREGCRVLRERRPALVYFSTTVFPVLVLGPLWRKRFGVPFVVDLQDPWVSDYYEHKPRRERPPKFRAAQTMHRALERWILPHAGGLIAVSDDYRRAVERRYPVLRRRPGATAVFGADRRDFDAAAAAEVENPYFRRGDGALHGVYAGVLGPVMKEACRGLCNALRAGLDSAPELFSRVKLHFIGTSYASGDRARETIAPIAARMGLGEHVDEQSQRAGYLTVLRVLGDADFLLILGSDNPQYTASKIYPYVLAERPILALLHPRSSAVRILRAVGAAQVVELAGGQAAEHTSARLAEEWTRLLSRLPFRPETDWRAFAACSARELTRRQCEVFDRVCGRSGLPA